MDELVTLNGKVKYIVYHNEDNFYTVAKFKMNDLLEKTITITGYFQDLKKNTTYNIQGQYIEHPQYGMQFQVESINIPLPDEREGMIHYLSGVQFAGIGKKTAEKIVDALGEDALSKIREDYHILETVKGLSEKHIQAIKEGLRSEDDDLQELHQFLMINGIGMRNIIRLNRAYGKEALSKIKENPYRVIEECDGFGFVTADKIGRSLGFQDDDPKRLYALLVTLAMDQCVSMGDSYIEQDELCSVFMKKSGCNEDDFLQLLQETLMKRSLVKEDNRIYPVTQFDAERAISQYFMSYPMEGLEPVDAKILSEYITALEKDLSIIYDEIQKKAIRTLFAEEVMIMTGGPGTGKTTVVKAMVDLFRMFYPGSEVVCVAPTGRAAKRLSELTGAKAATIHSLLQWDLETNTFGKNREEPITADLLIIDEFSMVDSWLFYNLLNASENVRKICIIGDEDQLPSVGPGCVLRDIIEAKIFPLIRLEHIYRQEEGNDIIRLSRNIREGNVEEENYANNVAFFPCQRSMIKDGILKILAASSEKGFGMEDIQVISPMYEGQAGINMMNRALQDFYNPPDEEKKQIHAGYMILREGDKILQLKNQPDDDVYNGDIGILEEIIPAEESESGKLEAVVRFQDNYVFYNNENLSNISLAYCISVHKSQGSEYPIVIMPFSGGMQFMLQKKLIYTAVTRARKSLILIGEKNAFIKGVQTAERHERKTTLAMRLKKINDM